MALYRSLRQGCVLRNLGVLVPDLVEVRMQGSTFSAAGVPALPPEAAAVAVCALAAALARLLRPALSLAASWFLRGDSLLSVGSIGKEGR